jgi:response regulator RpfG family c-di-GMP phosphodiesterase
MQPKAAPQPRSNKFLRKRILVVDDEAPIRELLEAFFARKGYTVRTAATASEALELIKRIEPHLVVLDLVLPDGYGLDLVPSLKKLRPNLPIILITGFGADDSLSAQAVQSGALGCISKTLPMDQLIERVESLLGATPDDADASEEIEEEMSQSNGSDAIGNRVTFESIATSKGLEIGLRLAQRMLAAHSVNVGNTAERVIALCQHLGNALELPPREFKAFVWAAGLHDISLVEVDRNLLRKWFHSPSRCTAQELALLRKHPEESQRILEVSPLFKEAGAIVRSHHESWDGHGYPDGLKREAIPWLSRLLSVAIHCCSEHVLNRQILNELRTHAGKFDPDAIKAVAGVLPDVEFPTGERELALDELMPGMVPSADLRTQEGMVVLAKGQEMTAALLNKLKAVSTTTHLDPDIRIMA